MNIQALFMFLKNKYISLITILLFVSCANIVSPQGGKKDEEPPYAKSSFPKDSTINFKSKKVIITFTENIQLKEPEKNITISPSLKNSDFIVASEKNELVILLKNLKPYTTYTIKANNSIADLTESNTLPTLKYVFSTGQYLDSLRITGRVVNATNLQKLTNVQVGLYRNFSDSDIILKEPDYYTFTDNQGQFTIDNISPGYYKLISIEDKNSNHLWNVGEGIAFETDTILIDDTINIRNLRMFYSNPINNHLVSASSPNEGVYDFEFDSIYESLSINQEDKYNDKKQPWYQMKEYNPCNTLYTKIRVFSKNNNTDTAHFNYKIRETIYHTTIKTSKIKPIFTSTKTNYSFTEIENPRIVFNQLIDTSSIKKSSLKLIQENTIYTSPNILYETNGTITIPKLKAGNYKLVIPRASFCDLLGIDNDSSAINIKIYSKDEIQSLRILPDSFIGDSYKLLLDYPNGACNTFSLNSLTNIDINYLIPGKYNITIYKISGTHKLLSNYNNFHVVYYKEIEIKKGFDLEEQVYILYP